MFKRVSGFFTVYFVLLLFLGLQTGAFWFYSKPCFFASLTMFLGLLALVIWQVVSFGVRMNRLITGINADLHSGVSDALSAFNIPILITGEKDEIIWYNNLFLQEVYSNGDLLVGKPLERLLGQDNMTALLQNKKVTLRMDRRYFDLYVTNYRHLGHKQRIVCFIETTAAIQLSREYRMSRPAVAFVVLDNLEELTRNLRDSERNAVSSKVQTALEDWFNSVNGISRRISGERYVFVFEQRDLLKFIQDKFNILSVVRALELNNHGHATISIGVGQGENLRACEEHASLALDMALGRGGDQVALRRPDGSFQFFGGHTAAGAKRSRVRARIVASALGELADNSKRVVIMGHRFADADCFGAAFALATAILKRTGRETYIALNEKTALIHPVLQRITALSGARPPIIEPTELTPIVDAQTLLIVVDTHRPALVEFSPLLKLAGHIVVIDHHRKAVDYINNAVIFYHETAASSACEMVSELLEYLNENSVGRAEAEALLAGIVLDTKNYCLNTGVRTFEASAFLRQRGADPIAVKKLFSDSMVEYKIKSAVISTSKQYKSCAIAVNGNNDGSEESRRIISSQAADELLNVSGIRASFVMYKIGQTVNISARSFGEINVQLIMESLGGGGHRMMAACQLENSNFTAAEKQLLLAIDEYEKG